MYQRVSDDVVVDGVVDVDDVCAVVARTEQVGALFAAVFVECGAFGVDVVGERSDVDLGRERGHLHLLDDRHDDEEEQQQHDDADE